jgi:CRISPR-associated protein Cas5d
MVTYEVSGPLACFTREMKVDRVSYPVITPSAALGLTNKIYRNPSSIWKVVRIEVLNAVEWHTLMRNEVKTRGNGTPIDITACRTQRMTVCLKNVRYRLAVKSQVIGEDCPDPEQRVIVDEAILVRRVRKGQYYYKPCLGMNEFVAEIELPTDRLPIDWTEDLGRLPVRYPHQNKIRFQPYHIQKGRIEV